MNVKIVYCSLLNLNIGTICEGVHINSWEVDIKKGIELIAKAVKYDLLSTSSPPNTQE